MSEYRHINHYKCTTATVRDCKCQAKCQTPGYNYICEPEQSDNVGQQINVQEVSLSPDTRNISIGQAGKMATWPSLQHNWPWQSQSYRAIDTCETISIKYPLLLQRFSQELQTLIARVYQQNREKVLCECNVALEFSHNYIKLSTCYIELTSLLLYKINYVIVKIVIPCFHRPSLLSRFLMGQHIALEIPELLALQKLQGHSWTSTDVQAHVIARWLQYKVQIQLYPIASQLCTKMLLHICIY